MTTVLENYENDPDYPLIWVLQESTERGGGLSVLTIPVISKEVAMAYADKRAGRMLDLGKAQGVDQSWQDYGVMPRGRDYVRQVCAGADSFEAIWQHVRAEFVITENRRLW